MPKRILNNRVNPKIIPAGALSLATKICSIGKSAYIVGSFNVRAILQMRFDDSSDIDFATSATGSEVRGILEIVSEIGLKY
jgi:tRNA nucleotidyltransferase/poly(A) polymerase